ncbi:MAG: hypothetical protein AAGL98_06520, partial [Planctomycetota bacterium]
AAVAGLWLGSSAVRDDVFLFGNTLRQITADRLLTNAGELIDAVLPEAVMGVAIPPPLSWAVTAGVAAAGWTLRRPRRWWAVVAGVFVVQWLVFLPDIRYVLPLLPLLLYGGWTRLIAAADRLPRRRGNALFGVIGVCVVGANLVGIGFTLAEQRSPRFYDNAYRNGRYAPVRAIATAIRDAAADHPDAVVFTDRRPRAELAVWSGRRVVGQLGPADAGRRLTFVVRPLGEASRAALDAHGLAWGPALAESIAPESHERWTLHRLKKSDDKVRPALKVR